MTGTKVDSLMHSINITANKNMIFGDKSAQTPGGIRMGTAAITSRGLDETDCDMIADYLHRACNIGVKI